MGVTCLKNSDYKSSAKQTTKDVVKYFDLTLI